MKKRYLTNLKQKVTIGDKEMVLSSLTLEAKERIDSAFDALGYDYNSAISEMISASGKNSVKLALSFVYGLIEIENNPYKTFEEFEKHAKKYLKPSELLTIINNVMLDSMPDFSIDEKKNTIKANLIGWVMILLATMGMIHLLIYLTQFLSPFLSILSSMLGKFSV